MPAKPPDTRAAFSPGEFAALFGKSPTWGYRQLYSGKVNAISGQGRLMIPASEVDRLTGTAGVYSGMPPAKKRASRKDPVVSKVKQPLSWREQVARRRELPAEPAPAGRTRNPDPRSAAVKRLATKPSGPN